MKILAIAFLLTVLIEWVVLALVSRLGFARTGWFGLWMNALTWGTAMGIYTLWPVPIVLLEIVIIVAETFLLRWFWRWSFGRSVGTSALMNLTSWLIGLPVVLYLIGWL